MNKLNTETFKVGDVVVLKSGGPRMTVCEVDFFPNFRSVEEKKPRVDCSWFLKHGESWSPEPYFNSFAPDALTHSD